MSEFTTNPAGFLANWTEKEVEWMLMGGAITASVAVSLAVWAAVLLWEWHTKEPVMKYEIAAPKVPEETRILEKPSIKVNLWLCHTHKLS